MTPNSPEIDRHYNRAPIREAIFLFSVVEVDSERANRLDIFWQRLESDYSQPIRRKPEHPSIDANVKNSARIRNDKRTVVEARVDGLSVSWLAPYDTWEPLELESRRIWDIYVACIGPVQLTRFATQYMNRIRIPVGRPLHEFLCVYPKMPDPEILFGSFFMFTQTDTFDPPGKLSVTLRPIGLADDGMYDLMLDNLFEFAILEESHIWPVLPKIRALKNATFNSQLTEELKETFA